MMHVFAHSFPLFAQTNLIQTLQVLQLLVPNGHCFIQDNLNLLQCAHWHAHGPKTFPNNVHKMMHCGSGSLDR